MAGAMRKMAVYLGLVEDEEPRATTTTRTTYATFATSVPSRPTRTLTPVRDDKSYARSARRRSPSRGDPRVRRRLLPDHDAAPAQLQRRPHGRGVLPRGHARSS